MHVKTQPLNSPTTEYCEISSNKNKISGGGEEKLVMQDVCQHHMTGKE